MLPWIALFVAGLLEIGWAIGLKYSDGFSKPLPSVLTIAAMIASMALLAFAVKTIPVGTGYAIWTGIGAVGAATLGILLFHEPANVWRIACLALIVAGIAGLKIDAARGGGGAGAAQPPKDVSSNAQP
jgi:quaternary ammonium compound-resistance protein SugE